MNLKTYFLRPHLERFSQKTLFVEFDCRDFEEKIQKDYCESDAYEKAILGSIGKNISI